MSPVDIAGRVKFERGEVAVLPAVAAFEDEARAIASIVSPGTELRQLESTRSGAARFAGYMNLVEKRDGSRWLAPTPHGAASAGQDARLLPLDSGLPLSHVALSRFQLIAAVTALPPTLLHGSIGVFGSGPVALGCILELRRQQVTDICVLSQHPAAVAALAPSARVMQSAEPRSLDVVFDCAGDLAASLDAVKDGGALGLLGTPPAGSSLDALVLHRRGIRVFGMHELRPPASSYLLKFSEVTAWLSRTLDPAVAAALCTRWPGEQAPLLYRRLRSGPRLAPFLLLEWC